MRTIDSGKNKAKKKSCTVEQEEGVNYEARFDGKENEKWAL